jgi:cation diffusion facilitator CzcD-associated flavoprotein CzcO
LKNDTTVVIGAGPYGLSIAAHLRAAGLPMLIFGKPMEFWCNMPPKMYLKSSWSALNISDPARKYSLNRYSKQLDIPWQEPVPLQVFLGYGQWFQEQAVPDIDETYITSLAQGKDGFHLDLADGRIVQAKKVVVATGIAAYAHFPENLKHLPAALLSHSQDHKDYSDFKDRRVVVVGGGQSALETAALLHEAGAAVELIARGSVIWIDRRLYYRTGPVKRIFYPPSDVGPPGVNWLVANPLLFRRFSEKLRASLDERAVRPAGATWLRPRVEGCIPTTPNTVIIRAVEQGQGVHLELSDGTTRDVDHIVLGTGYRADIRALKFIDPSLLSKVRERNGSPLLNEWFESSVPHLHFVGAPAGYVFGPLCRFVVGAKIPARQIARHARTM